MYIPSGALTRAALGSAILFGSMALVHAVRAEPTQESDDVGERPLAKAGKAMVAGSNRYSTEAALTVLHEGGNAVDASIAAALVAMVVEPNMVAFGGFGSLTTYDAATHQTRVVTYWMQYPDNFHPDPDGGPGAYVIAPGTPKGLAYVSKKYGKLPLKIVARRAIELARNGFPIYGALYGQMFERSSFLTFTPEGRAHWTPNGFLPEPGSTFRQEALARTLEEYVNAGPDYIYSGAFGHKLIDSVHKYGGALSLKDLADYQPMDVEAGRSTYRDLEVRSTWPPDSGGLGLALGLNILEQLDLRRTGKYTDSVESAYDVYGTLQAVTNLTRYVRDPAVYKVPSDVLLSKEFAAHEAQDIRYQARLAEGSRKLQASLGASQPIAAIAAPAEELSTGTVHISVIDEHGNACGITTSIAGDTFGQSGLVVDGVLINGSGHFRGTSHDHRWSSAAAPTIIFRRGQPYIVIGSPSDIYSTLLQVIPNIVDFGMDPQAAVSAPRMYVRRPQFLDTKAQYLLETRFKPEILEGLKALGASVEFRDNYANTAGAARIVERDPKTGELLGGTDPRRPGLAKGY